MVSKGTRRKTFIFLRCELAGTVNDSMEVRYRIWSGEKTEQKRNRKWQYKFIDMGLKCCFFYSNVDDTTLKARAVSGQSVFVKKDEEKFYGEDERKVIVS